MLGAARTDVVIVPRVGVEARDVGMMGIDLRRALRHPFRDHAPDAGTFLHPHRRRRPEIADFGGLAEQREAVGRERQQPVDRVLHLGGGEDVGHQLEGLFELLVEVVGCERQLGG